MNGWPTKFVATVLGAFPHSSSGYPSPFVSASRVSAKLTEVNLGHLVWFVSLRYSPYTIRSLLPSEVYFAPKRNDIKLA